MEDVGSELREWDRLSGSSRHAVILLLLILAALFFYAPVIITGKTLVGSDTVSWRANAQSVIACQEATGQPALWAPNTYAGIPAYLIPAEGFVERKVLVMRVQTCRVATPEIVELLFRTHEDLRVAVEQMIQPGGARFLGADDEEVYAVRGRRFATTW